jgi:ribose/xylose/arabinose/galactoside ABC-type transport system permease subunit
MVDWLGAAYLLHVLVALLAAIGFFRYWGKTHFWLPRYVHTLAAIGLAVGVACIAFMPASAPIAQSRWAGLKQTLLVLGLPALVYLFFVAYGGQRAAHERTHQLELCQYCRGADVVSGGRCPNCGQTTG